MGSPKAALEWHGSTLLRHVVGIVGRAVEGPVVVVRAAGQRLPVLPDDVEVVDDAREDRGPLQGIAAGLAHVAQRATVAFVTAVDAPLLHPAFIRHVLGALRAADDVALPHAHGHGQPLAAAYRTTIASQLEQQLAGDRLGTRALFARPDVQVRELDEQALLSDPEVAALDPRLHSLLNVNDPGEYAAARGRPAPLVTVLSPVHPHPQTINAATLAAAAAAIGIALGPGNRAILRDGRVVRDPCEPLVAGDAVTFTATVSKMPAARSQPPRPW